MGNTTRIGWTDKTWNPWQGCTMVSAGCDNCYMFRDKRRYGQDPEIVVRSAPRTFNKPLTWTEPELVFTCSWSDWFHKAADEWRPEAWDIIRRTPHLTYQILTKRSGRIARHLPSDWGDGYPNVWLGVSVENADTLYRVRHLLDVPARVRFISAEPLLGEIDFTPYLWGRETPCANCPRDVDCECGYRPRSEIEGESYLGWIIAGGESGTPHRRMELEWLASIKRQCDDAGVPLYVKQDSSDHPGQRGRIPDALWIQSFPTGYEVIAR